MYLFFLWKIYHIQLYTYKNISKSRNVHPQNFQFFFSKTSKKIEKIRIYSEKSISSFEIK